MKSRLFLRLQLLQPMGGGELCASHSANSRPALRPSAPAGASGGRGSPRRLEVVPSSLASSIMRWGRASTSSSVSWSMGSLAMSPGWKFSVGDRNSRYLFATIEFKKQPILSRLRSLNQCASSVVEQCALRRKTRRERRGRYCCPSVTGLNQNFRVPQRSFCLVQSVRLRMFSAVILPVYEPFLVATPTSELTTLVIGRHLLSASCALVACGLWTLRTKDAKMYRYHPCRSFSRGGQIAEQRLPFVSALFCPGNPVGNW